jgi:WhiB family redox-sensing transcriptional regulator
MIPRPRRPGSARGPAHGPAAEPQRAMIDVPAALAATARSPDWTDEAACRHTDPELFFPDGTAGPALCQVAQAIRVCESCPVRMPCLVFAVEHSPGFGVWGGTTPEERRAIRATIRRDS